MLRQARQFALGEINVLFEFTEMHKDLCTKKSCFHHSEMPRELIAKYPSPSPTRDADSDIPKWPWLANPCCYHPKLRTAVLPGLKKAGNPSFTQIRGFLKRDAYHIYSKGTDKCAANGILGHRDHGNKCRKKHKIASDQQVEQILEFLQPFLKNPAGIKEGK